MRVLGLAGWSGAGKTTLIERVIPVLRARGLSVSTVKHAHHAFDIDQPGKDSFRHRQAGATEVLVASSRRFALLHELRDEAEPSLRDHLARLAEVDLVLVEGFKRDRHAKIEVHRAANAKPFLFPQDPDIKALISDAQPAAVRMLTAMPHADFAQIEEIADLILRFAVPIDETLRRVHTPASGQP